MYPANGLTAIPLLIKDVIKYPTKSEKKIRFNFLKFGIKLKIKVKKIKILTSKIQSENETQMNSTK